MFCLGNMLGNKNKNDSSSRKTRSLGSNPIVRPKYNEDVEHLEFTFKDWSGDVSSSVFPCSMLFQAVRIEEKFLKLIGNDDKLA